MCLYILKIIEIIYSHIDHTLWSTFVLVLSSMVFGESCPKADSYMVSELLENSSSQAIRDLHLASSPQLDSRVSQKLGVSNTRSDLTIASGTQIQ